MLGHYFVSCAMLQFLLIIGGFIDVDGIASVLAENCIRHDEIYTCCRDLDVDFSSGCVGGNKSCADCAFTCVGEKKHCFDVAMSPNIGLNNPGTYPQMEWKTHQSVTFEAGLVSVNGLDNSGVLRMTLLVTLHWNNWWLSWDEQRCESQYDNCRLFLNRTKYLSIYVTKPERTRVYDFNLVGETTKMPLLSKKMEGFPLRVFRNGDIEWRGVIQVALKCQMSFHRYPIDRQECFMRWLSVPTTPGLNVSFRTYAIHQYTSKFDNLDWKLVGFSTKTDRFSIILRRSGMKELILLVIPIFFLNFLIGLSYLIPSGGERVGYSMTLVLTFAVLTMEAGNLLPTGFYMIITVVTFLQSIVALTFSILLIIVQHRQDESGKRDTGLCSCLGHYSCLGRCFHFLFDKKKIVDRNVEIVHQDVDAVEMGGTMAEQQQQQHQQHQRFYDMMENYQRFKMGAIKFFLWSADKICFRINALVSALMFILHLVHTFSGSL